MVKKYRYQKLNYPMVERMTLSEQREWFRKMQEYLKEKSKKCWVHPKVLREFNIDDPCVRELEEGN